MVCGIIMIMESGGNMIDNRAYLIEQHKLAIYDFVTAINENQQWDARKNMARIERTAIELYGDELIEEFENNKKKYIKNR